MNLKSSPASFDAYPPRRCLLRFSALCAIVALVFPAAAFAQSGSGTRLVNTAVRTKLAANETLIAGFVITGSAPARVLVRGIGPGLTPFGVTDAMPNPKIALTPIEGRGSPTLPNDDWSSDLPQASTDAVKQLPISMDGAFPLPANSRDAAMLLELKPGAYTLAVSGSSAADAGTVLVEVYDARQDAEIGTTRLINLSVRGRVDPAAPLLGGVVVKGTQARRFLIRVTGPAIAAFGVPDTLGDPRLAVFDGTGTMILSNDNWNAGSANATAEITEASLKAGAFPLTAGSRDAALIATLQPGSYTFRASGTSDASGTVLIETYELQD